jgi:peroxiredoxin Q/BCP
MAHRQEQKRAAREARLRAEEQARRTKRRQKLIRNAGGITVAVIAMLLVGLAVGLGGNGQAGSPNGNRTTGPAMGSLAPNFSLKDVVSGQTVSLQSLRGQQTLMFFSEGVSCAPCMEQAADLQKSGALRRNGVRLVSVTTDDPSGLRAAAQQYGITTPLLADPGTTMSKAYGMLSHGGMQMPGEDGHAFMLLDASGRVVWHQAYQSMYVKPDQLVSDMNARTSTSTGMAMGS